MTQLWQWYSEPLKTTLINDGAMEMDKVAELLAMVRHLAGVRQNTTVCIREFEEIRQEKAEAVSNCHAKLNGKASLCNFSALCPRDGCYTRVSYKEERV